MTLFRVYVCSLKIILLINIDLANHMRRQKVIGRISTIVYFFNPFGLKVFAVLVNVIIAFSVFSQTPVTDKYVDAVQKEISICGSGAQNHLTVDLEGICTYEEFRWEHDGAGYLKDGNSLNAQYVVNPKDVGKIIQITLSGKENDIVVESIDINLTIRQNETLDYDLKIKDEEVFFDDYHLTSGVAFYQAAPIKFSHVDAGVQLKNYAGDDVVLSNGINDGVVSHALLKIFLHGLYQGSSLYSSYITIQTTNAGDEGIFPLENALELYVVDQEWDYSSVTWDNFSGKVGDAIPMTQYNEYEIIDNGVKKIRKYFKFDIKSIVDKWYSGEMHNHGLYLKMAEELESSAIDIKVEANKSINDRVLLFAYQDNIPNIYLCEDHELNVSVKDGDGSTLLSGSGISNSHGDLFTIPSHKSMNLINRAYILNGVEYDRCKSRYMFFTRKTPVVNLLSNTTIDGRLIGEPAFYKVRSGIYNAIKNVEWVHSGTGEIVYENHDHEHKYPKYISTEDDFGTIIDLTATAYSTKDCTPETGTTKVKVLYPLYPYAGSSEPICGYKNVALNDASVTYELDEQKAEKAKEYVGRVEWTTNGNGRFLDPTLLNTEYVPAADDGEVICTLTVYSLNDFNSKSSSVKLTFVDVDHLSVDFGEYDGALVGEEFLFDKLELINVHNPIWSCNGKGAFRIVNGKPAYTPVSEDLDNPNQSVDIEITSTCMDQPQVYALKILPSLEGGVIDDQEICKGESVQLEAYGGERYEWSPGTGLDDPTTASPIATVSNDASYNVRIFKTINDKEYFVDKTVSIKVKESPEAVCDTEQIEVCPGEGFSLSAKEGDDYTYQWKANGELLSEERTALLSFPASTEIELIVMDSQGCFATDQVIVSVIEGNDVLIDYESCTSQKVEVSSSGYDTYSWLPESSFSCNNCNKTEIITPENESNYQLVATKGKCSFIKDFSIPLQSKPIISGKLSYQVCPGEQIMFQLNCTGNIISYSWSGPDNLNSTTILNPTVMSPEFSGVYTLTVVDANNCETSESVTLEVVDIPEIKLEESISISRGESIDVKFDRSADWIEWQPETGIGNPKGFYTSVSPNVTTTYLISIGKDQCVETAEFIVEVKDVGYAGFSYVFGEDNYTVVFTPEGEADEFKWTFGDGNGSNDKVVTKVYDKPGEYEVCLSTKEGGEVYSHCKIISIKENDSNCQ